MKELLGRACVHTCMHDAYEYAVLFGIRLETGVRRYENTSSAVSYNDVGLKHDPCSN